MVRAPKINLLNFFVILLDINECEDDLLNYCKSKLDCENTEGGYNCEKRKSKLKTVIVGMFLYLLNYQNKYKTKYTHILMLAIATVLLVQENMICYYFFIGIIYYYYYYRNTINFIKLEK